MAIVLGVSGSLGNAPFGARSAAQFTDGKVGRSRAETSQLTHKPAGYQFVTAEIAVQKALGMVSRLKRELLARHELAWHGRVVAASVKTWHWKNPARCGKIGFPKFIFCGT